MPIKRKELLRHEYTANCAIISAGKISGHGIPKEDTMYLKFEKEGQEITELAIRPDEAIAIAWVLIGAVYSFTIK